MIADWNIVLNAVVPVMAVPYGIWLKHTIDQQLKSKDTALQALEAVIKSKDAEISRLKTEAAPAITQAYTTMKQYADDMTAQNQTLSAELNTVKVQLSQYGVERTKRGEVDQLLHESGGMLEALQIFLNNMGTLLLAKDKESPLADSDPKTKAIGNQFAQSMTQVFVEVNRRQGKARAFLERPE